MRCWGMNAGPSLWTWCWRTLWKFNYMLIRLQNKISKQVANFTCFICLLRVACLYSGLQYIQQIAVTCRVPKYLKLLLKEPNNLPLNLKDDEQETEEQQRKKQVRAGILKFGVPVADEAHASLPLGSFILSRMKEMQGERMINYELWSSPHGTVSLWVVDKTGLWQPYSGPSSIINHKEGGHFQEYSSSEESLPEDITHEKILQLLIHLKHSASHSPSVGILRLHAHTSVWLFPHL